ncbi:MAG: translation initiation factor IF-1 [Candidatus Hydrogenedentales bacterium]
MAEEQEGTKYEGTVEEDLPNDMYRIRLTNGAAIVAHVGAVMRMTFTRIRPGERVVVELTTYDHSRGRIIRRLK